jgi:hypothetical protein
VARPQTPFGGAPPALPWLPAPVDDELGPPLEAADAPLVPPGAKQLPLWHVWPAGQTTPSHGQLPHEPVRGSQQEPSVHGLGWHLSATQVGGVLPGSQAWSGAHGGSQVGAHCPSTHAWPFAQVFFAHETTQVGVPSLDGWHSSSAAQGLGTQGLGTHAPLLQSWPQP